MARPVFRNRPAELRLDCLETREVPAVVGTVFQDFNFNGTRDLTATLKNTGDGTVRTAIDRGLGGVTITAYDASGTVRGTATSNAAGAYTLTISGSQTDPLRIQFTTLPPGFSPSPVGPDNGSSVQFVTDANATNVNFGAGRPEDFSEANPLIATNLYQLGHFNESNKNNPALVAVPYAAGGTTSGYTNPTTRPITVSNERLGSSFGLGWDRINRDLYNSAFFKRHAGMGPDGTGAVYRVPVPENPGPNYQPPAGSLLYADLNAIFGPNTAGVNLHDTIDGNSNGLDDDYDSDNISLADVATRDFG
ncbi:MAG: hypothetical protein ACRCZF_00445, partial [Gemmataceae bacterium]